MSSLKFKMSLKNITIIILFSITAIVGLQYPFSAFALEKQDDVSLICTALPRSTDSICYSVSASPNGPYDDVDIYHLTHKGRRILLSHNTGGVATFNGIGFSPNGRYMWESWAEEGHPYYIFYSTTYYLVYGSKTDSINVLDDYYFNAAIALTDNGEFIYSHTNNDNPKNCQDISKYITVKNKHKINPTACYKVIVLNKKVAH